MTMLTDSTRIDPVAVKAAFPVFEQLVHGHRLTYLDNANTTQKPRAVIDAIHRYYCHDNANVHRATYLLSERATAAYEGSRSKVQRFIGAAHSKEIIFTRGCTESINLVAGSWGRAHVGAGDEIVVTYLEHHSNIVPWQLLCQATGARLRVVPINDAGEISLADFAAAFSKQTRLASIIHVSNALGTVNPVAAMIRIAHDAGVPVLVDGAQAVAHRPVDVQTLDCEFYAFSGHKMYGPTGTGVLYGKAALLDVMPPWQGGGDMISSVSFEHTTYNSLPWKFEAGTPNIAGVVGLGAAIDWLGQFDLEAIARHEHDLLTYAEARLRDVPGFKRIGGARDRAGVISFVLDGVHPHDVGTIVDRSGVAIRTGQHCAQPIMDRFGVPATARASFGLYNTREDVDTLVAALHHVKKLFG